MCIQKEVYKLEHPLSIVSGKDFLLPLLSFRLNERGRTVAVRVKPVRFYDDLLPLIHRDLLDALFAVLSEQAEWATCEDLVKRAALRSAHAEDDIRFHLGLMLKRGLLDAAPPL